MLVYFSDGDRFIDLDGFSYLASTYDTDKDALDDKFVIIGKPKYYGEIMELYRGTSRVCDRMIKDICEAYERGDKVFRTKRYD